MTHLGKGTIGAAIGLTALVFAVPALAQTATGQQAETQTAAAPPPVYDPTANFFSDWFKRVDAIQAAQPHWMTPVATTTPRLEEEFRYDQSFQTLGHGGGHVDNFDGGKGLELIPFSPVEIIIGLPPYIEKSTPKRTISGWNDWPFFLVKYRLLSANEQNGNYILSVFLQGSAPTGIQLLTSHSYMVTPTIAGGVGFGDFDIQMTAGESFPTEHTEVGKVFSWNTALQYHIWDVVWPAVEFNYNYFSGGERGGMHQAFITPEVIFGRFHIVDRLRLIVGAGYQIAVMPSPSVPKPLTPMFKNNFILTTRFAF
ncbi:MAG TPA: hypothetical protein VN632_09950 [Stellaceae bacterium]|nr:hypothetical protein [Stellaceae bacterium]